MLPFRFWGLIVTQHRREFYAMYNLEHAGAKNGGIKTYLPLLQEGKRITPLFPNYLFVQFKREFGWRWAAGVRGVKSVVLSGGENIAVVPNSVIKELKERETDGAVQIVNTSYKSGDPIKVLHGPFIGSNAIYEGMTGPDRVMILMSIMGAEVRTLIRPSAIRPA